MNAASDLPAPSGLAMGERLRGAFRRDDVRQASWLTGGAVAGQVLALAVIPVLSRLYSPDAFGLMSVLVNVSVAAGALAGLCYEVAILIPRSERMARALYALAIWLSVAMSLAIGAAMFAISAAWPSIFAATLTPGFIALCVMGILTTAQFNAVGYAVTRRRLYGASALSKFNQTALPNLIPIALALISQHPFALLAGRSLGLVAANLVLQTALPRGWRLIDAARARFKDMRIAARAFADFLFHAPRQLLVRGSTAAPSVLLLTFFGAAPAGFFFLAQRVVERPGALLADSLNRVPLKQFAARRAEGKPLTRAALVYSAICAAPVTVGCAVLAWTADTLIPLVFGREWAEAAAYVVVTAWWAGVRLSVLPMSAAITALRRQRANLLLDVVFAFRVLVFPIMALHGHSALAAIAAFCALSILYDLCVFALGLWAVRDHDKRLAEGSNAARSG